MITAGTDLSFSIRQVNNRLTVAVMPRRTGLKGEAGGQIVPLVLNGTPEELDAEFLQAISTPVQKAWTLRCIDFQGIAKHPINHIQQ